MNRFVTVITAILSGIGVVLVTLFLGASILSFPVKWLWNYVIPVLFNLPKITYWQAFALFVLSGLLFKGTTNNSTPTPKK